jgi:predicted GIY-YIG superfamily endonuclease
MADCEVAMSNQPRGVKQLVANSITQDMRKTSSSGSRSTSQGATLKKLRNLAVEKQLSISKADKGNGTVILDKADYIRKCMHFITDNDFDILLKDPTSAYQKIIKNAVASARYLFSDKEKFFLSTMNPLPPRLYGLPKIHKVDVPIRPVVSSISAPAHNLAFKLNSIYRQLSDFNPKYAINNSVDLADRLKSITVPPNSKLVSFDVQSLFTSIPTQEALSHAEEVLVKAGTNQLLIPEVLMLMKICVDQNYFLFNGHYYKQKDGLAMGSPLSPLLAEVFMDKFEEKLFQSGNKLLKNIVYWFRYVDDILCCWTGTERQLDQFLEVLNSRHKSLNFTMERGVDQKINFLDLEIEIREDNHVFAIYRKPTYTDQVIPADSCHPISHKLASFNCMLHRLLNIPMPKANFDRELATIKHIAENNGYSGRLIDSLLRKKLVKSAIKSNTSLLPCSTTPNRKWCKIPFVNSVSYKIANILPKDQFRVSFYTPFSLAKALCLNKDSLDIGKQCGVYELQCQCKAIYIGQTGRNFSTRIKEHEKCYSTGASTSAFADHLIETNHTPNFQFKVLHTLNKGKKLDALEQLEIIQHSKRKTVLLNDVQFLTSPSPLLSITF